MPGQRVLSQVQHAPVWKAYLRHLVFNPAASAGFPGEVAAVFHWSSTPGASNASGAWGVNFNGGGVGTGTETFSNRGRAVRGGP